MEREIDTLLTIFSAHPQAALKAAFKRWALNGYREKRDNGWRRLEKGESIPAGHDWTKFNNILYIRKSPTSGGDESTQQSMRKRLAAEVKRVHDEAASRNAGAIASCPICGSKVYRYSVCTKCQKGKAGLKYQWICGEDSSHIFYTE